MKILGDEPLYTIRADLGEVKTELYFIDSLMILEGDSATGKTWLFKKLSKRSDAAELIGDSQGISLKYFDQFSNPEDIMACTRKVVVVDEAHQLEGGQLIHRIVLKTDKERGNPNQIYLLISRAAKVAGVITGAVELERIGDTLRFSFPFIDPEDIEYD